ncbi:SDR family NAD(P)-dependent oxidoreductase [Chelatococcus reniformis]|uniref:Short-chain dehydrogenase/reductase n=1 Tax=Chelatococcus reniformis TaxID=1494448 RepID=A0A916U312_9HYPH|nr:SDR family oxidoreductase [Chelatococcus reniformis]GGC57685.1 short-chain dehydrogenase/reductase [Chelatococcus reniformis]
MNRFAGKVAVITGSASGIGHATARLFAEEGAQILAVDRPGSGIEDAHAGVAGVTALAKSVADDDAPDAIVGAALKAFGGIDILFNNAGVSHRSLAAETADADWDRLFAVNVRAPFRVCRAAIPALRERAEQKGRARIINTASVMAFDTDIGLAAYTASKHAVAGLTKTLALELGKFKITANFLLPGAIQTGMTQASFADPHIAGIWAKKSALRRLGQPIDMARSVFLLASDEADFITGHGLIADGGLTLRT